jgi:hypothetical protein
MPSVHMDTSHFIFTLYGSCLMLSRSSLTPWVVRMCARGCIYHLYTSYVIWAEFEYVVIKCTFLYDNFTNFYIWRHVLHPLWKSFPEMCFTSRMVKCMMRYQRICVYLSICWICQVRDISTDKGEHGSSRPQPAQEIRVRISWLMIWNSF